MAKRAPAKVKVDWVAIALAHGVPNVTEQTTRDEAIDRMREWNALQCLRTYSLAPGWTVAEVLEDLSPRYYRREAARIAAGVGKNSPSKRAEASSPTNPT